MKTVIFSSAYPNLNDGYNRIIIVDKQAESVDYALIGLLGREDIVVTQDYGLAAIVISKGARAVNQNGLIFTEANIDQPAISFCTVNGTHFMVCREKSPITGRTPGRWPPCQSGKGCSFLGKAGQNLFRLSVEPSQ